MRNFHGETSLLMTLYWLKREKATGLELAERFGFNSKHIHHPRRYSMRKLKAYAIVLEEPSALRLFSDQFPEYAHRISEYLESRAEGRPGAFRPKPTFGCVGFIDCAGYETSRPGRTPVHLQGENLVDDEGEYQNVFYSGYFKGHGIKTQIIVAPTGLVMHLNAHHSIRDNDITSWRESKIAHEMQSISVEEHQGRPYYIYGDGIYLSCCGRYLRAPEKTNHAVDNPSVQVQNELKRRKEANKAMKSVRVVKGTNRTTRVTHCSLVEQFSSNQ